MKSFKYALLGLAGVVGLLISTFGPFKVPFAEALAKSYYRYALGALFVILLLISLAVTLFIVTFDANNFKTEIVDFVKTRTQRNLVLEGNIQVSFFPKLGLDSGRASLSQRDSAKEFASINNARLYIAWLPLLRRKLVFDHIDIDGVHVNLSRYKDGSTNFDDLLISDEHLAPLTFDIDSVLVSSSTVNWQDEVFDRSFALQNLRIETGRLADLLSSNLSADFVLRSADARLAADVSLKSRLYFDRKAGRYEFADINGRLMGNIAGSRDVVLNFSGSVDSFPAHGSTTLQNLMIDATGKSGDRNIVSRLGIPELKVSKTELRGNDLTLDVTSSYLDESLMVSFHLPAFEYAADAFKAGEISGNLDFKGQGRAFHAQFSSPLGINLGPEPLLHMDAISTSLSARHPALSVDVTANASGNLKIDSARQVASASFNASMGDSKFTVVVGLKDFSHSAYTFDINANRIDLAQYLSSEWLKQLRDDATSFDTSMLRQIKLRGYFRAGEITMGNFKASKLVAGIKVDQSTLSVSPLTAKLYSGALSGNISVSAQNPIQIDIKQSLKGFQMDGLLAGSAAEGRLGGKGDLALDLSAAGNSTGELRKSLNGRFVLALYRGFIAGIDLPAALLERRNELGTGITAQAREARYADRTAFSELNAAFNFSEGKSSLNTFEMKSPQFRSAGQGEFDPETGNIDYRLDVTVPAAAKLRTASIPAIYRGVTVPAFIRGPYASPSIVLDFGAASGGKIPSPVIATAAKVAEQPQLGKGKATKSPASTNRNQAR